MIFFGVSIIIFFCTAILTIIFIIIRLWLNKKRRIRYKKWKHMADLLIRSVILNEDEPEKAGAVPLTIRVQNLLENPEFKAKLSKQILAAKKNISGASALHLQHLYEQLHLHKFAAKQLNSKHWHLKAKAIQELGIMGQKKYLNKIYRHTNSKNELVRMEAQTAIVKLFGFEGLRFLDVISTQITDWQQIKLLQELAQLPPIFFSGIENWLESANESVVIFALKLAKNYHRFELYPQIVNCLDHPIPRVRSEAILALEKIYTADTSSLLLERFPQEDLKNQKLIIKVVQQIGYEADVDLLISYLNTEDVELKRMIVRNIAHISTEGITKLRNTDLANEGPMPLIIKQIEGEMI